MNKKDKHKNIKKAGAKSPEKEGLTRRDALRKIGYAAFASSTMLLLLNNPAKGRQTTPPGGGFPWDDEDNDDWD